MDDYLEINRANWDQRAAIHAASREYHVEDFLNDPAYLSGVVRFDQARLGPIAGLNAVHLQCHIGTDTLSLARLGAKLTGLDLSPAALEQARELAAQTGAQVEFVEADLYSAPKVLANGAFDLVYTGIGALCWLPSVARWAQTVAALLKPQGRLFIREAHPILDTLEPVGELITLHYPYYEQPDPTVWDSSATYVETELETTATINHMWSHGFGDTVTALLEAGFELTGFAEHDSAPWNALPGLMVEDELGEWRLRERPERLAATYTLQAVLRG